MDDELMLTIHLISSDLKLATLIITEPVVTTVYVK